MSEDMQQHVTSIIHYTTSKHKTQHTTGVGISVGLFEGETVGSKVVGLDVVGFAVVGFAVVGATLGLLEGNNEGASVCFRMADISSTQ